MAILRFGVLDDQHSHSVILTVRGQRVILDTDLAELYGVPTKALNQAVKRITDRFPEDFAYLLIGEEKQEVVKNCDHLSKPPSPDG